LYAFFELSFDVDLPRFGIIFGHFPFNLIIDHKITASQATIWMVIVVLLWGRSVWSTLLEKQKNEPATKLGDDVSLIHD